MEASTFLKATDFSISTEVKLTPLDPEKIETVSQVNLDTIEFIQSETLESLLKASATADNSIEPDYASYQPLNEAGLMTAGNSVSQSAMSSNVNNALGIQSDSLDSLSTAEQIIPNEEDVEEQSELLQNTKEAMLTAQTTISTALIGVANNADKAEGAQKIASPTQLEIGGNSIYLVSETMLHTSTPVVSTVADVISVQAKTNQLTADLSVESLKNKYSNVEETSTEITNNKITTVLGRNIAVASDVNNTSLNKYTINADTMEAYSQSLIELRSTKSTRITANENIVNQAGNISITASSGSKKNNGKLLSPGEIGESSINKDGSKNFTATNAAGEKVKFSNVQSNGPKWKTSGAHLEGVAENKNPARVNNAKGNIAILAEGVGNEGGSLTIVNNSQTTSSKNEQINLATNINHLAENNMRTSAKKVSSEADLLTSISSGKNIQISTSSNMTLMSGGITFQGLRRSDINKISKLVDIGGPIDLIEIPRLPKLPTGLSADSLKACLKKGKLKGHKGEIQDAVDDVSEQAEAIIAAGRTLLGLDKDSDNLDDITLNKKPKKKQKVEAPTVEEASRRKKEHPLPTGKDTVGVSETLEDTAGDPGSIKLPNMGPLSETTSPTSQSLTESQNQVISAAGVIEGGSDVFLEDEEGNEDIMDEHKDPAISGSGDGLENINLKEGQTLNEVQVLLISSIDNLTTNAPNSTETVYQSLAKKFVSLNTSYVLENSAPVGKSILFEQKYKDSIIKYLKRKYTPLPLPEYLEWNNSDEEDEEQSFNNYFNSYAKEWINFLDENIKQLAAIGGIFDTIKNSVNFIKSNVNISDNIDDLKSKNTLRVLQGLSKTIAPKLGGEYFTDASNIIKQSTFLQDVYVNVSGTFEPYAKDRLGNIIFDENNNPVLNNKNNITGFINALDITGLQKVLTTATNIIGAKNITVSKELILGLTEIKNSDIYIREGYSSSVEKEIINLIKTTTQSEESVAEEFYFKTKDRLRLLVEGDLKGATKNLVIDEVLASLLGPANTQAIKDLSRLYTGTKKLILAGVSTGQEAYNTGKLLYDTVGNAVNTGEDLYTAIKAAPGIISMMNYYEIPTLNQVSTLITCLDIKNNIKDVIQNVRDISGSINKLEELGGDLFNILGEVGQNFGTIVDVAKKRVNSLKTEANGEPQTTSKAISTIKNTGVVSSIDIMSDITGGMVSGSLVSNVIPQVSIPSEYVANITPNTSDIDSNQEQIIQNSYLESKKSISPNPNICPKPYSAFANENESIDPANWQVKVEDEEFFKIVETLPRLTQMYNSILELPEGQEVEGLSKLQIVDIKNTKINIKLDPCFTQVKLNAVESNIQILELKKGAALFKLKQPDILNINNKNITIGPNTLIQVYAEEFYDKLKERVLRVQRTSKFYTPYVYNFKVIDFKINENVGLAQLIPTQSRIYLKSIEDNLVYNYSILDIGNKLEPQILDSYVVL